MKTRGANSHLFSGHPNWTLFHLFIYIIVKDDGQRACSSGDVGPPGESQPFIQSVWSRLKKEGQTLKLLSRLQDLKYLSCINTKQSFHLGESCVCAPAVAEHIAMVLSVQVSSIHLHPKRDFIILFLNTRAGSRDKKGAGVVKSVAEELRLFFLSNASYPSECRGLSSDHGDFQQQSSKRKWTEKGFSSQQQKKTPEELIRSLNWFQSWRRENNNNNKKGGRGGFGFYPSTHWFMQSNISVLICANFLQSARFIRVVDL